MVAAGNDFIIIAQPLRASGRALEAFVRNICDRKYGAGADGMLVLEKSRLADVKMRVFNADGSEAEMCGNGARCVAYYRMSRVTRHRLPVKERTVTIETTAGIITALVSRDTVKIRLSEPKGLEFGIPLVVQSRLVNVDYVNTGVPHVVIFVHGLDELAVGSIAPRIRYHKRFAPRGTNVNFVEIAGKNLIKVRTYERGVEDETRACGTGSAAAAIIFALKSGCRPPVKVHTRSGEILKVYWTRGADGLSDVWLEGKAHIVYEGEYAYV